MTRWRAGWRAVGLTCTVIGLAGCEARRVYFTPTDKAARRGTITYILGQAEDKKARAFVGAHGFVEKEPRTGEKVRTIAVVIRLENRLAEPVTIGRKDLFVLDDEQRRIDAGELLVDNHPEDEATVATDQQAKLRADFELPVGQTFRGMGSFRLFWTVQVGEQKRTLETKFVKTEPPEVYYEPYPYPPYPYYHYYYDPWFHGPYPYGGSYFHGGPYFYGGFSFRRHNHRH